MITKQQRPAQNGEMYGNHTPETATHFTYLDSQDIPREGHLSNAELGCNVNKEEATTEERPLEIPQGWLWSDEMDAPSLSAHGMTRLMENARQYIHQSQQGECVDQEIETVIQQGYVDNAQRIQQVQERVLLLENKATAAKSPQQRTRIARAIGQQKKLIEGLQVQDGMFDDAQVTRTVQQVLAERERKMIDAAIDQRIEANRYPWQMINSEYIPDAVMTQIVQYYQQLIGSKGRNRDGYGTIRIPGVMSTQSPDDRQLLTEYNIDIGYNKMVSRSELQEAGVFFVNTVGEGEQPIFGVPIPDETQPDGYLHVENKVLLTKEELQKVYDYQQAQGYGIGDYDPDDVVMDMIMLNVRGGESRFGTRSSAAITFMGDSERINKYGKTSSPFVGDSDDELPGQFGGALKYKDGTSLRLTAVQAALINRCQDYPGMSEMYDENTQHDQRYISASQYIREIYLPQPTKREVFDAIKQGAFTARERAWVGGFDQEEAAALASNRIL